MDNTLVKLLNFSDSELSNQEPKAERSPSNHGEPSNKAKTDGRVRRRTARLILILMRARGFYADLCDELDRTDPESDEYCLLLSNGADDLAALISGLDMLQEARA